MYIRTTNPQLRRIFIRDITTDGPVEFTNHRARVPKEIGEALAAEIEAIVIDEDESNEEENDVG